MKTDKFKLRAILGLTLVLGTYFRLTGINWDQGYHLQPDERYISMVSSSLSWPKNLGEYLDPNRNPLSPYLAGFGSYIYGQLPLTALTYLSRWSGMEGYDKTYLLGRTISALLDTLSILLTFKLGKRLWGEKVGIIGAVFYAFSPLPIQYSHFMTMESWLTFFWLLVILMLTRLPRPAAAGLAMTGLIGVLLGAAMAVKLSSVLLLVLVLGWIVAGFVKVRPWRPPVGEASTPRSDLFMIFLAIVIAVAITVLSFRFFQPTIFTSTSWLDWSLRQDFLSAFNFQQLAIAGKVMFPPQWQWMETAPVIFLIKNLGLWGLGPVISILLIIGITASIYMVIKKRDLRVALLLLFSFAVIGYNGIKFVKTMRYAVPLLGILAVFAGVGADWLIKKFKVAGRILTAGLFIAVLVWAFMFTSIYRNRQTRIMASQWIYSNIPPGSKIMLEEWDDPLPLLMPGYEMFGYQTEMVGVYAPDDEVKRGQIDRWLADFDWIVLSSPRAKGSIGKLPKQFPLMSSFYRELENGTLGFVKAAEFTSFPKFSIFPAERDPASRDNFQFSINDSSAEESFWVYDHPKVEIYKKLVK